MSKPKTTQIKQFFAKALAHEDSKLDWRERAVKAEQRLERCRKDLAQARAFNVATNESLAEAKAEIRRLKLRRLKP